MHSPACVIASRMLTPSASFWSSHVSSKWPVSAPEPRNTALKRWPSSSAKPTTSMPNGRRRPLPLNWRTQAMGARMPSRPSYLPPLRTVS